MIKLMDLLNEGVFDKGIFKNCIFKLVGLVVVNLMWFHNYSVFLKK